MKISVHHKRLLQIFVKLLITAVLIWAVFHHIQFSKFWAALLQINKLALLLCVFFFGISCVFRAVMWRATTFQLEKVGMSTLFGGIMVGYMANNILPFRAGEIVRTYYLASRTKISENPRKSGTDLINYHKKRKG